MHSKSRGSCRTRHQQLSISFVFGVSLRPRTTGTQFAAGSSLRCLTCCWFRAHRMLRHAGAACHGLVRLPAAPRLPLPVILRMRKMLNFVLLLFVSVLWSPAGVTCRPRSFGSSRKVTSGLPPVTSLNDRHGVGRYRRGVQRVAQECNGG